MGAEVEASVRPWGSVGFVAVVRRVLALLRPGHPAESPAVARLRQENARLEEELRRSRDVIEHTARLSALGSLAAGIAHEIRNPLVSIRTFFQLAPRRWDDPEFATGFLELTAGEVERMSDLVTELLGLARPSLRLRSDVQLDELVEQVLRLLAPQARQCGVRLARDSPETEAVVFAVPDQIKQVLVNLLLNAVEATPSGGEVRVGLRRCGSDRAPCWRLEVADEGCGVPPDVRTSIFEPFVSTKDGGTGLGLWVARRIVSEHGGSIELSESSAAGSRFAVSLPASLGEQAISA